VNSRVRLDSNLRLVKRKNKEDVKVVVVSLRYGKQARKKDRTKNEMIFD